MAIGMRVRLYGTVSIMYAELGELGESAMMQYLIAAI